MPDPDHSDPPTDQPFDWNDWEMPARRTKFTQHGSWHFVRSMRVPEDLHLLSESVPAPRQTLDKLRHTHHQLARLIATGVKDVEASLITGYQPTYIAILKTDPSFQELLSYYSVQREQIFVDVVERMRSLGLATLDEIQARLAEGPEDFTRRELMELAELLLIKPSASRQPAQSIAAPSISVNVKFVSADSPKTIEHIPEPSMQIPLKED